MRIEIKEDGTRSVIFRSTSHRASAAAKVIAAKWLGGSLLNEIDAKTIDLYKEFLYDIRAVRGEFD